MSEKFLTILGGTNK